ncbi:DpnI domain-containing protein [Agrobacterium bohemicum]|uniref:DpnI domain-containing protein n=1 Tax=Agrobacterium bohemicum TaxID=2052828 RepID=UPI001FDA0D41|nr:DpnI domain-containing protein [Agrobacterium bohemicum]
MSGSQKARVLTEAWIEQSIYCPNCGNQSLKQFPRNLPVADFYCMRCNDQYELKSQKKPFGRKIANGAYQTKVERLESDTSPNLILMRYDVADAAVRQLYVVPKRFFTASLIERRKPLKPSARRAGWVGSNILLERIPQIGLICVVQDGIVKSRSDVLSRWQKTAFLERHTPAARGWLVDVMSCIDQIENSIFTLDNVYSFTRYLSEIYPNNNNVKAKIRQQLQILRDNGYLEFLGAGIYRRAT